MPLANFTTLCVGTNVSSGAVCISIPGGVQLCASVPSVVPTTGLEQVLDLFGKLNTALGPLQPIFNIIDAILAIFDCIKAISTLDPVEIVNCIPNLAERVNALLALIPQLSLPILVRDAIDALILYVENFSAQLIRASEYFQRIVNAQLAASNTGIELGPVIDCANANLAQLLGYMGDQAEPVNRIIGLINAFLQLLGLECIPPLSAPSLDPTFILLLDKLVEFLEFLRNLISIPIPTPQLAVSADDC